MPRRLPVWGFPNGYDPNLMGEVCEICQGNTWIPRPVPNQPFTAWTCAACTLLSKAGTKIPSD